MKGLRYILMIYISMSSVFLYSQVDEYRVAEIVCSSKEYQFEVEDNFYDYGKKKKVYVCPKNLPVEVLVVKVDGQAILGSISWEINDVASSFVGNPISLIESDFKDDVVELRCNFSDNGVQSLEIKILKNIALKFSEKEKKYQFDDNKIQAYRDKYYSGTQLNVPWNFIEAGKFDVLRAKATRKKGYYAINTIEASSSDLLISPTAMDASKADIKVEYTGMGHQVFDVTACAADPELYLYTDDMKMIDVQFFELCDTDDDNQFFTKGTIVANADVVCADGGIDLTFDGGLQLGFVELDDIYDTDPISGRRLIRAGPNKTCDTKVNPKGPPECPSSFNTSSSIVAANGTLNKVGIVCKEPTMVQKIFLNYNLYGEDGFMDSDEQFSVHFQRVNAGDLDDGVTEVWLVNYLDKNLNDPTADRLIGGRASVIGANTLAISVVLANTGTFLHEMGHAKWRLLHPTQEFNIKDLFNFMHGKSNELEARNIRRYQFDKMHN